MTLWPLIAAIAAGVALLCATTRPRVGSRPAGGTVRDDDRAWLQRLRMPLTALCFVAGWAFVGGGVGVLAGALAAGVGWRVLGQVESPAARLRRETLARDLPAGVDLLGAVLGAGGSLVEALRLVGEALPGPLQEEFDGLRHQLQLGVDPVVVWSDLAGHAELGPLGRALRRTPETGAPVTRAIEILAVELRAEARAVIEERARSVDVKSAAPLGLCFLPAFVLLGVVPLVVGIFGSMDFFG